MKLFYRFALCFCALALLAGCGGEDARAPLYGKWVYHSPYGDPTPLYYEFHADGRLITSNGEISETQTYEFLDDDTIQITSGSLFPLSLRGVPLDWKVEEDTLWISMFPDQWLPYTRVKE